MGSSNKPYKPSKRRYTMKQKMVITKCLECGKEWKEKKTWHGQSEMCSDCVKERTLRNNCKRHGGRDGNDCFACGLEGKF